jgi:uncharacterized Fe-S cluster-containing radical SAM superfamily protein
LLENYCPEIYHGLFVDRWNDDRIQVAPCCQADMAIENVETFSFENSEYLTKLRAEFNQGQKPAECKRCWEVEQVGLKSRRQSAIEFEMVHDTEVRLQGLDHSATWACNSACIMCGPLNSSSWAKELNFDSSRLDRIGRKFQKNNQFESRLNFEHIKKLHFNGGEPLLNNEHVDFLTKIDLSNVQISYNSNGTCYPSDRLLQQWKRARLVKIFFSIDATESAFEYIRYPGIWQQVHDNICSLKQNFSNLMFGINLSVGNYNVLELPLVWQWFENTIATNAEGDPSDFNWQLVNQFDLKNLPANIKIQAIQDIEKIGVFGGIVEILKSSMDVHNANWYRALDSIDQRRNTSWRKSLRIGKYYS